MFKIKVDILEQCE